LVKEKGVILLSGAIFDMKDPYFRIGLGRLDFKEGLMAFDDYLVQKGYTKRGYPWIL